MLHLADDAQGTDRLSGWAKEDDADALAELGDGPVEVSVKRLTVAGSAPLVVLGGRRDRLRCPAPGPPGLAAAMG
ncbi:hypothetical protein OG982_30415 [Streptomyces sp. NBC_01551]|uniref:hypothetical protein n=1 Tax=Streptomyces sp. NBC_01551 TaxID=2975876 RepID=UPI00225939BA|nr:hypothetical protein [Streptomyces sp. NBC_01551]MCX4529949.1 hypothetical protein [Streptomyces sp. NBC_01551]